MKSRGKRKKVVDPEDRFVATIAHEHRQLPHEIKNPLFRCQLQLLDKQNTTQGNFNNQNVNNRNSFFFSASVSIVLPFNSSHGNSFPIQQPHNQNYNSFRSPENTHYVYQVQSPSYPLS